MIKMFQALIHGYYTDKLETTMEELVQRKKDMFYLEEHRQGWSAGETAWLEYHIELKKTINELSVKVDRLARKLK